MSNRTPLSHDRHPRTVRTLLSLLVLTGMTVCGCSQQPVPGASCPNETILQRLGLNDATHALIGPTYVPPDLRDGRVAMDQVELTDDRRAVILNSLSALNRVVSGRVRRDALPPAGSFCRYYRDGHPVGPWLIVEGYRATLTGGLWMISAYTDDGDPQTVRVDAFLFTRARPDLTGAYDEVDTVYPAADELFPICHTAK